MERNLTTSRSSSVPGFSSRLGQWLFILLLGPLLLFAVASSRTEARPVLPVLTSPDVAPSAAWPALAAGSVLSSPAQPAAGVSKESIPIQSYDLVIYGTTSSGIGALREFTRLRGTKFGLQGATVAIISPGGILQSPLANGLGLEDLFQGSQTANGPWKEFRDAVLAHYRAVGIPALNPQGRLVFEAEVASQILWWDIDRNGAGCLGVTLVSGSLVSANAADRSFTVDTDGGVLVKIKGKVVIDASAELDLARKLGVSYRIGTDPGIYNDVAGNLPPEPTAANGYDTAPQSMTDLVTYSFSGAAARIAKYTGPYDPATYDARQMASVVNVAGFLTGWSTMTATLPFGKHEFAEASADWRNPQDLYDWVIHPEKRPEILARIQNWDVNQLRHLQETAYPGLSLVNIYPWPYFRGEVMIANGLESFSKDEVGARTNDPATFSNYESYDRHGVAGNSGPGPGSCVWIPWRSMMPEECDWLLVPEGACSDYQAYDSAFRSEAARMDFGGAAGVTASLAIERGVSPQALNYQDVREALDSLGYRLGDRWQDIADGDWALTYGVTPAQVAVVADGYANGDFQPFRALTRGQFAKMLVQGFSLQRSRFAPAAFVDVPPGDPDSAWVQEVASLGLVSGYDDGTYRPSAVVTRQQALSVLGGFLAKKEIDASGRVQGDLSSYGSLDAWYAAEGSALLAPFADQNCLTCACAPGTAYLVHEHILDGLGEGAGLSLHPTESLSRAQAVTLIVRATLRGSPQ